MNSITSRPISDRRLDARIVMLSNEVSNEVSDESADDPEHRTSVADSPLGW
jgi:hypothetical protein